MTVPVANGASPTAVAEPAPPALELCDIRVGYDRLEILHGVSLEVPQSTVVALLGPNGAGKTTTLRVASGRLTPRQGTVRVDGVEVTTRSPDWLARRGVCAVPEGRGIFPNLTVAENLRMWTFRGKVPRSAVEERSYARFPVLAKRRKQVAGTLSGGEQQMLAMSRALSTEPKLLLLDEISMGLAPLVVAELYEVVAQIAAEGFAILVVEQFVHTALKVATRAAVMAQGRIELEGSPDEVRAAVADIYLRSQ